MNYCVSELSQFDVDSISGFEKRETKMGSEFYPLCFDHEEKIKFSLMTDYIDLEKVVWSVSVQKEGGNVTLRIHLKNSDGRKLRKIFDKIISELKTNELSKIIPDAKKVDDPWLKFKINRGTIVINYNAKGHKKKEEFNYNDILDDIAEYGKDIGPITSFGSFDKYDVRIKSNIHRILNKKKKIKMIVCPVIFKKHRQSWLTFRIKLLESKYPWMQDSDMAGKLKEYLPVVKEISI